MPNINFPHLLLFNIIDIVGVVHECGEVQTITAKASQRELRKRELGMVDTSNCLVRLTLWGEEAENFDGVNHPVVVIKAAKVSDFNGTLFFVVVLIHVYEVINVHSFH